jgi:hypothetical protein
MEPPPLIRRDRLPSADVIPVFVEDGKSKTPVYHLTRESHSISIDYSPHIFLCVHQSTCLKLFYHYFFLLLLLPRIPGFPGSLVLTVHCSMHLYINVNLIKLPAPSTPIIPVLRHITPSILTLGHKMAYLAPG